MLKNLLDVLLGSEEDILDDDDEKIKIHGGNDIKLDIE